MSLILSPGLKRIAQPWALKNLPPFRPVAMKLIRLAEQPNISLAKVQDILRTDATFSAEVLRLANSALISARSEAFTVARAVEVLGMDRIKALAMTVALRDFVPSGSASGFLRDCWRYNLATAILCEWLAGFTKLASDACYTAGLMHDLGRLAILRTFPREYERALATIEEHQFDLLRCEKSAFDIDHCEAGAWLMERWGFPNDLCEVVAFHHREPDGDTPLLVTVVYIAWQLADMLGLSPMGTRSAATIEEISATLEPAARAEILAKLEGLPELVAEKLSDAESASA